MLGIDPYVYARSGRQWNEVYQQAKQTEKEHGDDIDAFVIFAGTNDYNQSVPIGEWYEEVELPVSPVGNPEDKRKCRVPVMNDSTLKGRINIVMDYLKTNYPEKQVIVLTPLHRGFAQFNENNIQYAEGFGNKAGLYIDEYVTAIKEAANVWAVNVIDLNSISGLYPVNDSHAMYFAKKDTDRLDPNEKGHYRMAKVLK